MDRPMDDDVWIRILVPNSLGGVGIGSLMSQAVMADSVTNKKDCEPKRDDDMDGITDSR